MKKIESLFWLLVFISLAVMLGFIELFIKLLAPFLVLFGRGRVSQYGMNILEGYDNFASAQTGGDPDESISSRLGKATLKKSGNLTFIAGKVDLVALELFGDEDHCVRSIERDEGVKQVTTH